MTRWIWYGAIALGAWWVGRHWDAVTFAKNHQTQIEGASDIASGLQKLFGGS